MIYAKFIEITGIGWKKVKQGIESGLSGEEISQLYSKVKELGKDETIRQLSQTRRIQ